MTAADTGFRLEHRYQDSAWEPLDDPPFEECGDAICKASEYADDAIAHGMVRVVGPDGRVIQTFSAGGGICHNQ